VEKKTFPYETIIFVCNNARPAAGGAVPPRISCAGEGRAGADILERLKAEVKERRLKGRVRVSKAGCLDLCEQGPNVMVFEGRGERFFYGGVVVNDVPELVRRHFPENQ